MFHSMYYLCPLHGELILGVVPLLIPVEGTKYSSVDGEIS